MAGKIDDLEKVSKSTIKTVNDNAIAVKMTTDDLMLRITNLCGLHMAPIDMVKFFTSPEFNKVLHDFHSHIDNLDFKK